MNTSTPGLAIIRDPGRRESYTVVHVPSGIPVILGLPGPGSAQDAALDVASLLDWAMTSRRILTVLEAFPEIVDELERIARKWGGTSVGHLPGDEYPFRVSA